MVMKDNTELMNGFRWLRDPNQKGEFKFTFDGERIFNLFRDYPHELTEDQKRIFDSINPYWADYFKDRV